MADSKIGKGTYYPGRTKPLCKMSLSELAKVLEVKGDTFASPCGNKGGVYKIEMMGSPGKYRYALLNDRIGRKVCGDVGNKVPLVDLSFGLAEYFGIKGRKGIGEFRVTHIPSSKHPRIAFEEGMRVWRDLASICLECLIDIRDQVSHIFNPNG